MPAKVTEIVARIIAKKATESLTLEETAHESLQDIKAEYGEGADLIIEGLSIPTLKALAKRIATSTVTRTEMQEALAPIIGDLGGERIPVRVSGTREFEYKPFGLCTWPEISAHHERKEKASIESKKAAKDFGELVSPLAQFMIFNKERTAYEAALMLNERKAAA